MRVGGSQYIVFMQLEGSDRGLAARAVSRTVNHMTMKKMHFSVLILNYHRDRDKCWLEYALPNVGSELTVLLTYTAHFTSDVRATASNARRKTTSTSSVQHVRGKGWE